MRVDLRGISIPVDKITGVSSIRKEREKWAFCVDVGEKTYRQAWKTREEAEDERNMVLAAMGSPEIPDPLPSVEPESIPVVDDEATTGPGPEPEAEDDVDPEE